MTARRRLLAAASATFALLALTAARSPRRILSGRSYSGGSFNTEAAKFCF
jgi:hypothetical protein